MSDDTLPRWRQGEHRDVHLRLQTVVCEKLDRALWRTGLDRDYFCAIAIAKLANEEENGTFSFEDGYMGMPLPRA